MNASRDTNLATGFGRAAFVLLTPVAALVLSQIYGWDHLVARVILALAVGIWTYVLDLTLRDRSDHLVMLCFALFNLFGFIVPGMIQCASDFFPFFAITYSDETTTKAAVVILLFSLSVFIAYHHVWRRRTPPRVSGATSTQRPVVRENPNAISVLAPLLACSSIVLVFVLGQSLFLAQRTAAETLFYQAGQSGPMELVKFSIVRDLGFLALGLPLTLIRVQRRLTVALFLPLVLGLVSFAITNDPLNEARFVFGAFAIALVSIVVDLNLPRTKAAFAFGFVFSLVFVMPTLNELSGRGSSGDIVTVITQSYWRTLDYDGLQSVMNVIMWTDATGLKLGAQLGSAVLFFLPRAYWAAKPVATGMAAAQYMGYPSTNISAPLAAEFYSDFGFAGVAVLSGFVGWLFARLDRALDRMRSTASLLSMLPLFVVAGFTGIVARGALLSIIGPVASAILVAYICVFLCTTTSPKSVNAITV